MGFFVDKGLVKPVESYPDRDCYFYPNEAVDAVSYTHLDVYKRQRHYVIKDVNARIDLDSKRAIRIDMETGKFGGTAIGDGLVLKGRVAVSYTHLLIKINK